MAQLRVLPPACGAAALVVAAWFARAHASQCRRQQTHARTHAHTHTHTQAPLVKPDSTTTPAGTSAPRPAGSAVAPRRALHVRRPVDARPAPPTSAPLGAAAATTAAGPMEDAATPSIALATAHPAPKHPQKRLIWDAVYPAGFNWDMEYEQALTNLRSVSIARDADGDCDMSEQDGARAGGKVGSGVVGCGVGWVGVGWSGVEWGGVGWGAQ
jgi:hypothetical protein